MAGVAVLRPSSLAVWDCCWCWFLSRSSSWSTWCICIQSRAMQWSKIPLPSEGAGVASHVQRCAR
jgi:hypothetical protein